MSGNVNLDALLEIIQGASKVITSTLVIVSFLTMTIKPLRNKFTNWILKSAQTNKIVARLDDIDKNLVDVKDDVSKVKKQLETHIGSNDVELARSNKAHMYILRGQIREIYARNYQHKEFTLREQRDMYEFFEAYLALGGNSYVVGMVDEMKQWKVKSGV